MESEEHNHVERGGGLWGKALNLSNNEQTTINLHSRWNEMVLNFDRQGLLLWDFSGEPEIGFEMNVLI